MTAKEEVKRFRPLAGIMVLIPNSRNTGTKILVVSVPLRGLWFLSSMHFLRFLS